MIVSALQRRIIYVFERHCLRPHLRCGKKEGVMNHSDEPHYSHLDRSIHAGCLGPRLGANSVGKVAAASGMGHRATRVPSWLAAAGPPRCAATALALAPDGTGAYAADEPVTSRSVERRSLTQKGLGRESGREQLESFLLAPWASRRVGLSAGPELIASEP